MKKKLIAWLLVICMAISLLPAAALADTAATSGKCGDNVTWTLSDDGTLTISGKGAMYDYDYSSYDSKETAPWSAFNYVVKKVVVKDGITKIGDGAFYSKLQLETASIPGSVKSIGNDAFSDCRNLTNITIEPGTTTIGDRAFKTCQKLTMLPIPNTVKTIGRASFGGCRGIINLVIPDSIQSIDEYAFSGTDIETVSFGKNITRIPYCAFNGAKIKDIFYSGTKEQYKAITIEDCGGGFSTATVHYNHTHNYSFAETVAPTCTEKGYDKYVCANGEFKRENYVKAKGHTEVVVPGYPATYEKEGLSDGKICSECGATLVKQSVIPVRVDYISDVYIKDLTSPQIGQKLDYDITLSTSPNANMIADGDKAPIYEWYAYNDYTGEYEPITAPNYICNSRSYRLYITMYPTEHCGFDKSTNYWLNGDLLGQTAGDMKIEQLKDKGVRIQLNFGVGRYDDAHTISTVKYTNMPSTYSIGDKVANFTPGTLKGVGEYFWYIAKLDSNENIVGMYVAKEQEATMLKAMPDLTSSDIADARKSFGTTFESDYYYALYNYQIIPVEYQFDLYVTVNVTYRNGETASVTFEGQGYDEESQPLAVSTSLVVVGLNPVPALKITTSAGHPKLSWNAVPGAAKYWIYRSTDGKNFKYYDSTTKTSYTNNSTTIGTTYYYKVKAVDSSGTTTDYSAIKSIKCTPAAPSLRISRVNGKPKLSWDAVNSATKYWIYRSTDGKNFKYYDSTTKTSYTNSGAASGTKYYYKVKAVKVVNGNNVASAYSYAKSLVCTPATPNVSITSANGKPKLSWNAVNGATKYWIYRSTDGENFKYYDSTTKTTYTNISTTVGTRYYYKVKAVVVDNGTSYASAFSIAKSLVCTPATPNVSITSANGKPKLSWNAVNGATKYWIYRSTDGENFKYYDSTTKTTYTNNSTTVGTRYYYKVKAVVVDNGTSYASAFSSAKSMVVRTAAPTLKTSAPEGTPSLSWNAVNGADKYWVYRSTDGVNFKYYDTTTKTTYTNKSVTAGTTYYYKVKAVNVVNGTSYASGFSNSVSVLVK